MKRYSYYVPVIIIVFSNVLYDISAKAFPKDLNAQAGLTAYYIIAAAVSLLLFYLTSEDKNFPLEAAEMAQGFVLSCQARPTTDRLTVSYDER